MTTEKASVLVLAMRCIRGFGHGTGQDAGRDRVTPKFLGPGGRTGFGSIKLDARPGLRKRNPGSEWRIANSEWKFLVSYSLLLFATRHSPFAKKTRQAERRQTPYAIHPHHTG